MVILTTTLTRADPEILGTGDNVLRKKFFLPVYELKNYFCEAYVCNFFKNFGSLLQMLHIASFKAGPNSEYPKRGRFSSLDNER